MPGRPAKTAVLRRRIFPALLCLHGVASPTSTATTTTTTTTTTTSTEKTRFVSTSNYATFAAVATTTRGGEIVVAADENKMLDALVNRLIDEAEENSVDDECDDKIKNGFDNECNIHEDDNEEIEEDNECVICENEEEETSASSMKSSSFKESSIKKEKENNINDPVANIEIHKTKTKKKDSVSSEHTFSAPPSQTTPSVMKEKQIKPPTEFSPPPALFRYLLRRGRWGHVVITMILSVMEFVNKFLPQLYSLSLLLLRVLRIYNGPLPSVSQTEEQSQEFSDSFANRQYAAFVPSGSSEKGRDRKQKKQSDLTAMDQLLKATDGGQISLSLSKYAYLSNSFMKRRRIGPYRGTSIPNEPAPPVSSSDLEPAASPSDKPMPPASPVTERRKRRRPVATSSTSDRLLQTLRSSALPRRMPGAYPGDAPGIDRAGCAAGVIDIARRYGYGSWSDESEENEEFDSLGRTPESDFESDSNFKTEDAAFKRRKKRKVRRRLK